jgi:hypothetical protein
MKTRASLKPYTHKVRGKNQQVRGISSVYHTMPQLSPIHKLFLGQKSSDSSQSKYKRIVDIFKYSGGLDEAEIYLTHWGVSPTIKGLLLAYAEYDALIGGGV